MPVLVAAIEDWHAKMTFIKALMWGEKVYFNASQYSLKGNRKEVACKFLFAFLLI